MSARDDIAAYLLGELTAPERDAFERTAAGDAELRSEVERLRPVVERLHRLDGAVWTAEPAPALRLPETPAARAPRTRWAVRLRPAFAALAAVVLVGAGIAIGLLAGGAGDDAAPGGRTLALAPVGESGVGAAGEARLSGGSATVDVSGLPPSAEDQFYELWLLNSADDLVSLASFRVPASGKAEVTVPVPGGAKDFSFVDVSVEPQDGDPAHSGDSVLRGRIPGA